MSCLRTNNMNFTQGQCNALKDEMMKIKLMIAKDNEMAVAALKQIGATIAVRPFRVPEVDLSWCPEHISMAYLHG